MGCTKVDIYVTSIGLSAFYTYNIVGRLRSDAKTKYLIYSSQYPFTRYAA